MSKFKNQKTTYSCHWRMRPTTAVFIIQVMNSMASRLFLMMRAMALASLIMAFMLVFMFFLIGWDGGSRSSLIFIKTSKKKYFIIINDGKVRRDEEFSYSGFFMWMITFGMGMGLGLGIVMFVVIRTLKSTKTNFL